MHWWGRDEAVKKRGEKGTMGERGTFRECVCLWVQNDVQVSNCVSRLLIHTSSFLLILLPT